MYTMFRGFWVLLFPWGIKRSPSKWSQKRTPPPALFSYAPPHSSPFLFPFYNTHFTLNHFHSFPCRTHRTMLLSLRAPFQGAADGGVFAFCCSVTSDSIPKLLHTHPTALLAASSAHPLALMNWGFNLGVKNYHLIYSLNLPNLWYLCLFSFPLGLPKYLSSVPDDVSQAFKSFLCIFSKTFPTWWKHPPCLSPTQFL